MTNKSQCHLLTDGGPALGPTKPCFPVLEDVEGDARLTEACAACGEACDQTLLGTPAAVETAAPKAAASALG